MNLNSLKIEYNKSVKNAAHNARVLNIESFSNLDRKDLKFQNRERRLHLYTTRNNEKLYIQYPGKESINNDKNKIRPWDFRPKLIFSNGNEMDDLSFKNIWDDITEIHNKDSEMLSVLAAIFFNMSVMRTHDIVEEEYDFFDFKDNDPSNVIKTGNIKFNWYKPIFDNEIINNVEKKIGKIRGASLEAYLVYNDLLVQNEDCKYFYRDAQINNKNWNDKIGRCNTLRTHLSVISFLQGYTKFSNVMDRFQRQRGVAPCIDKELELITNGIVVKVRG